MLAGIGFTMALFIAGLAFGDDHLNPAKLGILSASVLSAVLGTALLAWSAPRRLPGRGRRTFGQVSSGLGFPRHPRGSRDKMGRARLG
jgi:Na+/H+ antiporter 1